MSKSIYKELYYKYNDKMTDITDVATKHISLRFPYLLSHAIVIIVLSATFLLITFISYKLYLTQGIQANDWLSYLFLNISTGFIITLIITKNSKRLNRLKVFYSEGLPFLFSAISDTQEGLRYFYLNLSSNTDKDNVYLYSKLMINTCYTIAEFIKLLSYFMKKKNFKNYSKFANSVNEEFLEIFAKEIDPLYHKSPALLLEKKDYFIERLYDIKLDYEMLLYSVKNELIEIQDTIGNLIYGK